MVGSGRPLNARRADYDTPGIPDRFIVLLLRDRIGSALRTYRVGAPGAARALDVGCGAQPFRAEMEGLGYVYHGLDVVQNTAGTVDWLAAIDQPLPEAVVGAGRFDLILATEVLEHVADWLSAFDNLARLLAPGGKLLVTCPHVYPLHEEPFDFWRATPHALRLFAGRAGLRMVHHERAGDAWDVLGTLLGHSPVVPASDRTSHWVAARVAELARQVLVWLAMRPRLRRGVVVRTKFYLANIAVFEPESDADSGRL